VPIVTCPYRATPVALPDPWTAPGFTCPSCRPSVALAVPSAPPPQPPPANPFELDDVPSRSVRAEHRNRTRAGDAMVTGFGDAFGRVFGTCAAQFIIGVFVVGAFIVIGLVLYASKGK
jgi:hypothetical protein